MTYRYQVMLVSVSSLESILTEWGGLKWKLHTALPLSGRGMFQIILEKEEESNEQPKEI